MSATPSLRSLTPRQPNGAAVLVAGGGGYTYIDTANEAHPAAKWLTDQGVTAFILIYRLPREGWHNGPLAPLQDAQRAIRMMRSMAEASVSIRSVWASWDFRPEGISSDWPQRAQTSTRILPSTRSMSSRLGPTSQP